MWKRNGDHKERDYFRIRALGWWKVFDPLVHHPIVIKQTQPSETQGILVGIWIDEDLKDERNNDGEPGWKMTDLPWLRTTQRLSNMQWFLQVHWIWLLSISKKVSHKTLHYVCVNLSPFSQNAFVRLRIKSLKSLWIIYMQMRRHRIILGSMH